MKAISSLYVKFREKISALFARRLQSIKATSFLPSFLPPPPSEFGGGALVLGGGGGGERGRFCISYKNGNKSAT